MICGLPSLKANATRFSLVCYPRLESTWQEISTFGQPSFGSVTICVVVEPHSCKSVALVKSGKLIFFQSPMGFQLMIQVVCHSTIRTIRYSVFFVRRNSQDLSKFAMNPFNIHITVIFARPTSSRDIQVSHAQYMSRSFGLTLACQDPFFVSDNTCYFWKRISHFCSVILASLSQLTAQSISPTPPYPCRVGNYGKALLREMQSDFYKM